MQFSHVFDIGVAHALQARGSVVNGLPSAGGEAGPQQLVALAEVQQQGAILKVEDAGIAGFGPGVQGQSEGEQECDGD
jgi:hypothetical protein